MDEPAVQSLAPPSRQPTRWGLVTAVLLLGMVLGCLLIGGVILAAGVWRPFASLLKGTTVRVDVSAPSVVEKIRQLARLETVDYSIDKIVEGDRQNPLLPNFLAGDKLLLIAHGEVVAGVDLSHLDPQSVHIDAQTAHVHLPAAQILFTRIDNTQTRVYSRTTGLLVQPDPNLESQVRQAAEQQITSAALADGILDKARQNARVEITGLLYALGFRSAEVQ